MRATLIIVAFMTTSAGLRPGATRHDVPDGRYRSLAQVPAYESVALLLDGGRPEASAVLVNPSWVLTAGHEVDAISSLDALTVRIGGEELAVREIVRHPRYQEKGLGHGVDLALLRLSETVQEVEPAEVYAGHGELGRVGTTVGYGVSGTSMTVLSDPRPTGTRRAGTNRIDQIGGEVDGRAFPENLMIADFDSPDDRSANRIGDASPLPLEYLPLGGDSGGGLFVEERGSTVLAGIVSALTPRISEDETPGLYGSLVYWVRVSLYRSWIAEVMGGATDAPARSTAQK